MVNGSNNFERFDLVITHTVHEANKENGVYAANLPDLDIYKLEIKPEGVPSFQDLMDLISRVGGKYGWDRRREYHDTPSKEQIEKILQSEESRRFSFNVNGKDVGGVIVANVEPLKRLKSTFSRVSKEAPQYTDLAGDVASNTLEIYKIGLEDRYTGMRLGKFFFGELLGTLFKDDDKAGWPGEKPKAVYLNTRNTNHDGVLRFYKAFNMNVINALTHANDLISQEQIERLETPLSSKEAKGPAPASGSPNMNISAAPV